MTRAAVDQNSVAAEMQREMNRQLEELRCKNEEELNTLREENQGMRAQIEHNPPQREESRSNEEGGDGTGRDESRVQTTTNQIEARPRVARRQPNIIFHLQFLIDQATPGFELGKKDLQSPALPLGHAANKNIDMKFFRILPPFLSIEKLKNNLETNRNR